MKQHAAAWIKGLFKYALGFGVLIYVVWKYWEPQPGSDTPGLKDLLRRTADVPVLIATTVLVVGTIALQILRWYFLVRALDLPFTVRNAFRLGLVGAFSNTFLPGGVGGDLVKAVFIAKDSPGRRTAAVATVVADRAIGLFGLILYVAVVGGGCWLAGNEQIRSNDYLQYMVRVAATIVGCSVVGWFLLGFLPTRQADRLAGGLRGLPKVGGSLSELWYTVWTYRQRPKVILLSIAISAVAHTLYVVGFYLAAQTFPPPDPAADLASLPEHFVIVPIGMVVQALPLSPGGVGVGEAFFGWLYQQVLHKPASTGIMASLIVRVITVAFGLVGYVVYLRMRAHHELPEGAEIEAGGGKA